MGSEIETNLKIIINCFQYVFEQFITDRSRKFKSGEYLFVYYWGAVERQERNKRAEIWSTCVILLLQWLSSFVVTASFAPDCWNYVKILCVNKQNYVIGSFCLSDCVREIITVWLT
jgi:hypothetical protein